ncbi:hypothetical protein, partial [Sphingobacterium thalpophilum]
AVTGGRVGRCLFLHGSPCWKQSRASFVYSGTCCAQLDDPEGTAFDLEWHASACDTRHFYVHALAVPS